MRIEKYSIILIAVAVLAACASASDLRSRSPDRTLTSTKNAKAVSGCLADKLEVLFKTMDVSARPTTSGYAVAVTGNISLGKDTPVLVDVDDTQTGSTSRLYTNNILSGGGSIIAIAEDCQK